MAQPSDMYPGVAYKLDPDDARYEEGRRFRLDQLDGGQYFFRTKQEMQDFVVLHGFHLINEDEMNQLRTTMDQSDE